jgi:hypothetical protein
MDEPGPPGQRTARDPVLSLLVTGENGQAIPTVASWLAVVVLMIFMTVAIGYGVVVVREEVQDRSKPKLESALQVRLAVWLCVTRGGGECWRGACVCYCVCFVRRARR